MQTLIEALWGKSDPARNKRRRHYWKKLLSHNGVERILKQTRKEALLRGNVAEVETALSCTRRPIALYFHVAPSVAIP
jgi:hypothetical protein